VFCLLERVHNVNFHLQDSGQNVLYDEEDMFNCLELNVQDSPEFLAFKTLFKGSPFQVYKTKFKCEAQNKRNFAFAVQQEI
jgi:hypothetical protein